MDQLARLDPNQKTPAIEVKDFSGLSLKADSSNQLSGVWQELENFDLYIPGSIRKVLPAIKFSSQSFPNRIYQFTSYWAEPNRPNGPTLRVIGMDQTSKMFDLTTGELIADLGTIYGSLTTLPFMEVLPTFLVPFTSRSWFGTTAFALNDFVLKYNATDGILYVFAVTTAGVSGANEPTWITSGPITDGSVIWNVQGVPDSERFQENAIIVSVPNKPSMMVVQFRFDPTNDSEVPSYFVQQVGFLNPTSPIQIGGFVLTPNLDGYFPQTGRAFAYTWNDANTLHEVSPSPLAGKTKITEVDSSNAIVTIVGSILQPLVNPATGNKITLTSYQQYYLSLPLAQAIAALAAGYESIFFYATTDGGSTFFRITELFDPVGNSISNSDGSVAISVLIALQATYGWQDYTPLPTPQSLQNSIRVYEGGGPVNLVPDPENFGPDSWVVKSGTLLEIIPGDSPDGNAAVEQVGTGSPQPTQLLETIPIPAQNGKQYYFQGYLDASQATAGTFEWRIVSGDGTHVYLTLIQGNGNPPGLVSGTFVKPVDSFTQFRVQIRSVAGSITADATVVWAEPLLIIGSAAPTVLPFYPTQDDALLIPAPATLSQGPPPSRTLSIAVFQGSLFVLEQGTFRTWFSISGDFQSFGANSFLVPDSSTAGEPVLELVKAYDRLVLGKLTNVSQVTGNNQTNYAPSPIDPQHGVLAARSSISIGNALMSLLNSGLALIGLSMYVPVPGQVSIGFRPEDIVGDVIKPLVDSINPNTLRGITQYQPCPAMDNTNNRYLFANRQTSGAAGFNDTIFCGTLTHKGRSIWSILNGFPTEFITLKEIQMYLPTNGELVNGILATGQDGYNYILFGGTQDQTLVARATTWALPDLAQLQIDERDTLKTFREIWIEGEQLDQFEIQWSLDYGETWTSFIQLRLTTVPTNDAARVQIGQEGRQIMIRFQTIGKLPQSPTPDPLISYFKIYYETTSQAQGGDF